MIPKSLKHGVKLEEIEFELKLSIFETTER